MPKARLAKLEWAQSRAIVPFAPRNDCDNRSALILERLGESFYLAAETRVAMIR